MHEDTIQEAALEVGETLALIFARNKSRTDYGDASTEIMEYDIAFFEVQGREWLTYKPYTLKEEDGSDVGTISSEEGESFDRLWDDRGRDLLRVSTSSSPWVISHFGIGVLQNDIRIYPRIPETERHPGWSWANQSEPEPQDGDPYGYISGRETGYHSVSAATETFAFQSGDRSRIEYGFYNSSPNVNIEPTIALQGFTYRVAPITDTRAQAEVLVAALDDDESSRAVTWGTISDSYTINLPDEWDDVGAVRRVSGGVFNTTQSGGVEGEELEEES